MTFEQSVYLIVTLLWLCTMVHGLWSLGEAIRFNRYVRREALSASRRIRPDGRFEYQPRVVVILPCCGLDEKLHRTVDALAAQNFDDYEVVFTFESEMDPAFSAIGEWTRGWSHPRVQRVVAGLTERRSQKIHNLLAALGVVSADREVLVFLDSDAVPGVNWLGHLVAPLKDPWVGAATGYRWYTATGGVASGIRSAWNAATVTLLEDPRRNFCWGGATAIRRETFVATQVAGKWDRALSDDYVLSQAVRDAALEIRFVPAALVPSSDSTTLGAFWSFARRQLMITRVCNPDVWWSGFLLCMNFMIGGTATAFLFAAAFLGWLGTSTVMWAAFAGWMAVLGLTVCRAWLRQKAIRSVLPPPDATWRDSCWDIGTVCLSGMLHLPLMLSALLSRRLTWRNTVYELVSATETRVLQRLDRAVDEEPRVKAAPSHAA